MGDPARFRLFADLIKTEHPDLAAPVADVASGCGKLQAELRRRGYLEIESWDRRPRNAKNRRGYRYGRFDYRSAPRDYRLVVGMHPDQATDQIVMYAAKHGCPFMVCPCCVLPSAIRFYGGVDYDKWLRHLEGIAADGGLATHRVALPMAGRNVVISGAVL